MKLFSGTTNLEFSTLIAKNLNVPLSSLDIDRFADGEIKVTINECIRQEDCVIIQPTCRNNDNKSSVNDSKTEEVHILPTCKTDR